MKDKIGASIKLQIGINIKKIRQEKELDIKKVCIDLDMSPAAYGNIERGLTDLNISRIIQLSNYFNVHVSTILATNNIANFNFRHYSQVGESKADGFLIVLDHLLNEINFLRTQNDYLLKRNSKK